jgi:hypothetical protein
VLVTGQDLSSVTVSFTASTIGQYSTSTSAANITLNGTTSVTVNSVSSGSLAYGTTLTATDIPTGDYLVGQVSGTTGGAGQYTLAQAATGSVTEAVTGAFANGFLFIDATCSSCDSTGSGTITSPWQTLQKIYGTTQNAVTSYVGGLLYLRGNSSSANYEAYDQTGVCGIEVNGNKNPEAILAYPGDPAPNIDISQLTFSCSGSNNADHVFGNGATGSDIYYEGFSFSGTPGTTSAAFDYFVDNQITNRLTYHKLTVATPWIGSNPTSSTTSFVLLDQAGSGATNRSYVAFKGLNVSNINFTGPGVSCGHIVYNVTYGVTEFSTCTNDTGSVGFLTKDTNSYYTKRYNLSTGTFFPLASDGFLIGGNPTNNTYMEDAYNYVVSTATAAAQPTLGYELSSTNGYGNVFIYRNTVYNGVMGVAQDSNYTGSYAFQGNADQFGTAWTQAIISNISSAGWANTPLSSVPNVTDATAGTCEAASAILTSATYPQLTGACLGNLGQIGAGIQ